jgi:phenylalanyl-tRNA synthetase beta chain
MQTSLSWLSTHIDLSASTTAQLTDLLTFAGVEVEGVEEKGVSSDKVVVAQIAEFVQHPNADKLSVCQVDDGSGSLRQIVCGAKNFKAGDKVPLALPGAILPGNFEIKEGKLRGVVSGGMMCSGKELGIGEDTGGLMILDASLPVGKPFKELVKPDVIFDLEITPNRSDLLSHLGLARELSALTGLPLKSQRDYATAATKLTASAIKIEATEACPFYTARLIKGVKVGPSPDWLKARLESIGLRPINNIVDITNYVLMEMGQPLHAFDVAKLNGSIVVRHATEGEKMLALDGNEYTLDTSDMVIADSARPVAIAGVMGGEDTGVTEGTTDVLLESAYFQPSGIRRTSRKLGLSSDSSYRFERGVDPQQVHGASELATKLILELAGGTAEDSTQHAGAAPKLAGVVVFDEAKTRKLLGIPDLSDSEMHDILGKFGLSKTSDGWQVPSYRLDLQRSVDLAEEIARVVGLDRVPSKQSAAFASTDAADKAYDFAMQVRHALVHRGFNEAQTLRLVSNAQLTDSLGVIDLSKWTVPVKNPLSEDHTTLRPSIVPGLIATAALNIRQGNNRLRFFELGRIFLKLPNGQTREDERLAILISGPVSPSSWHGREPQAASVYDLRGIIEQLPGLTGQSIELKKTADNDTFLLSAELKANNKGIGWIAQLHPSRARAIDARHPVYVAEIVLSSIRGNNAPAKFEELPRFPAITRDVAMEVPADLPHQQVATFFAGQKEPLLIKAEVFDVFTDATGTKLAQDRKSIAWTLTYRASDRTLETNEVELAHGRILAAIPKALPATIR